MSAVLHLTGIDTPALRRVIVAHRQAVIRDDMRSIPRSDGDARPYVGVLPRDKWSVVTLLLSNQGAAEVLAAVADPRKAELDAVEAALDEQGGTDPALLAKAEQLRAAVAA